MDIMEIARKLDTLTELVSRQHETVRKEIETLKVAQAAHAAVTAAIQRIEAAQAVADTERKAMAVTIAGMKAKIAAWSGVAAVIGAASGFFLQ